MKHLFTTVSVWVALMAHALPVIAATSTQLAQVQQFLTAKQPEKALGLLQAAHYPATASTQEFFLLGVAAKQSGQLAQSEGYFRSALQREPNAGRIRLELAEVLYRQGKLDASKAELLAVRGMNPPQNVRQNIDGFIAQVDAAKATPNRVARGPQKNWSAYITSGFTSDSNVNAGPDTNTVFLYGLPFTLSSSAMKTQDSAWFVRGGFSHVAQINGNTAWRSDIDLAFTNYFSSDTFDTTTLTASSGPSFRLNEKASLSIPLTYEVQRYNQQGGWYSQSWGLAPRLQYAVSDKLQVYIDSSISRKRFEGTNNRNLTAYSLNPSLNYRVSENGLLAAGLQFGRESSGLDIYSNTARGAYIGYQHRFAEQGISASITASLTDTKFDGIQAAYTQARHDISQKISASMSYTLPNTQGLTLQGNASYQNNKSNLDINAYDRTLYSFSLTKRF